MTAASSIWGKECGFVVTHGTKITQVNTPDGKPSMLYKDILEHVQELDKEDKEVLRSAYKGWEGEHIHTVDDNKHLALAMYAQTKSKNFQKDYKGATDENGEPVLKDVLRILPSTKLTSDIITPQREDFSHIENFGDRYRAISDRKRELQDKGAIISNLGDTGFSWHMPTDKFLQKAGEQTKPSPANPVTLKEYEEFLNRNGFHIQDMTKGMVDAQGKPITPENSIDLAAGLVKVIDGERPTALGEEAWHLGTRIIKKQDPKLFSEMMNRVGSYQLYADVLALYKGDKEYMVDGKPNIPKIKEEAIGRLLHEYYVGEREGSTEKPELTKQVGTWWQRVLNSLKDFFLGSPFRKAAKQMAEGKLETKTTANEPEKTGLRGLAEQHNLLQQTGERTQLQGVGRDTSGESKEKKGVSREGSYDDRGSKGADQVPYNVGDEGEVSGELGGVQGDHQGDRGRDIFKQKPDITEGEQKRDDIFDNLTRDIGLKKPVDEQGDSYYEMAGKRVKNRVTDRVKKYLEQKFRGRSDLRRKMDQVANSLKKQYGVGGHSAIEDILKRYIDPETGLRRDTPEPLQDGYVSQIDKDDQQEDKPYYSTLEAHLFGYQGAEGHVPGIIDQFPEGTKFLWEKMIYDPKQDLAGTIDFIAITPDGVANIWDWKFKGKLEEQEGIRDYMKKAYDIQMANYADILEKHYSVSKVQQARMIPISVKYADDGTFQSLKVGDADYTKETKSYMLPYPTSRESTGVDEVDRLVRRLGGLLDQVKAKPSSAEKKDKVARLEQAILSIRLGMMFKPLVDQAKTFIEGGVQQHNNLTGLLKSTDFTGMKQERFSELISPVNEAMADLQVYKGMGKMVEYMAGDSEEDKELRQQTQLMADRAQWLLGRMEKLHGDYYAAMYNKKVVGDIRLPEREIGQIGREFQVLSKASTETMQAFYDINNKRQHRMEVESNDMLGELVPIKEALDKWGGGGAAAVKKYQDMLERKDESGQGANRLIPKYKPEYFQKLSAICEKAKPTPADIEWIKENTDKARFQQWADKHLQEGLVRIKDRENRGLINAQEAAAQELYLTKETDLSKDYAWLQEKNIRRFPIESRWHSDEYKRILEPGNKPALGLYNFITKWNKTAADAGYIEHSQMNSFLPWVSKSLAEKVALGGDWSITSKLIESFTEGKQEGQEKKDPVTGEIIWTLPKYFVSDISVDKDGKKEYGGVSDDWVKNMAIYANKVIDYKAKSDIEELVQGLVYLERYKGMLETDRRKHLTGSVIEKNNNLKYLEDAIRTHMYGESVLQSFDVRKGSVEVDGKEREYSMVKSLNTVKTAYSLTVLGFNATTSVFRAINTNLIGTYSAGKHYTPTQQMAAFREFCAMRALKGSYKLHVALMKDLLPVEENLHLAMEHLTANTVTGANFQEVLMKWVKSAHNIVQYTNFLAHLKNAVVIDGKLTNARTYYRDSAEYAGRYGKSEAERTAMEKGFEGKVQELIDKHGLLNKVKFNETTGKVEYDGIDLKDDSVAEWKSLVRNMGRQQSGNISENDQSHMRSNAYLRQMMLFTNWIPQQIDIRFGELAFNKGQDAWEYGRARLFGRVLFKEGIVKGAKNLINMYKANVEGVEALHKLYTEKAAEFKEEYGKELTLSPEQFYDLVRRNIAVQTRELLSLLALGTAVAGIYALAPKKDDPDYEETKGYWTFAKRVFGRCKDELELYYNPSTAWKYADSSKFPALGFLNDVIKAAQDIGHSAYGYATDDPDIIAKSHITKDIIHNLPLSKGLSEIIKITDPELEQYTGAYSAEVTGGKR